MASPVEALHPPEVAFLLNVARVAARAEIKVDAPLVGDDGVTLARAGAVLDEETAKHVIAAGRTSALQLRIPRRLDRHHVRSRLRSLTTAYPDLGALDALTETSQSLQRCLNRLTLSPALVDLLTLLDLRCPSIMEQTLVGAWIAIMLARGLEFRREQLDVVFLSALARDVGHLFVSPHLLDLEDPMGSSRAGRSQLRTHPHISALVVEKAQKPSPAAIDAIRWHHARVDGSGFPPPPPDHDLSFECQLVGFADALARARLENAPSLGRARKVLLLNLERFDPGLLGAFERLVDQAGLREEEEGVDARADLIEMMLERALALEEAYADLDEEVRSKTLARRLPAKSPLLRVARELLTVMKRSGHGSSELRWWLKAVRAGRDDVPWSELVDIDLQQRELQKEVIRLRQSIEEVAPWSRSEILGPELL